MEFEKGGKSQYGSGTKTQTKTKTEPEAEKPSKKDKDKNKEKKDDKDRKGKKPKDEPPEEDPPDWGDGDDGEGPDGSEYTYEEERGRAPGAGPGGWCHTSVGGQFDTKDTEERRRWRRRAASRTGKAAACA